MMKVNEEFNNRIKSEDISNKLVFRIAEADDIDAITDLMMERNSDRSRDDLLGITEREVTKFSNGKTYGIFVALYENKVVGFCRYYRSDSVPQDKIKHKAPEGYYATGIMVTKSYRRKDVAKFLSMEREKWTAHRSSNES